MFIKHDIIEKNVVLLAVLTLITISIGGLVQIIPLFAVESTIERVKAAFELADKHYRAIHADGTPFAKFSLVELA